MIRTPYNENGRYACEICGRADALDAVVSAEVWAELQNFYAKKLKREPNILCLQCMDDAAAELEISAGCTLHFAGKALHGTSRSDSDDEFIGRLVGRLSCMEREVGRLEELLRTSSGNSPE